MRAFPARLSARDSNQEVAVAAYPAAITMQASEDARFSSPRPWREARVIGLPASIARHGSGDAGLSSPARQRKAAAVGLFATIAKPGGGRASAVSSLAKRRNTLRPAFFPAIARQGLAFGKNCLAANIRELAAASIFAGIYAARAGAGRLVPGDAISPPCLPTISSLCRQRGNLRSKRGALRRKHHAPPARPVARPAGQVRPRGAQPAGAVVFLARRVKRPAMISFNASKPAPLTNTLASA